uniref:Reverse transcriptase N-terminal domain-containing protein n=1 Tax=Kumanoa mahlacensis TaxID=1196387 RepID=A0A8K1YU78_9FLOR|nr:hypothetical protein [Kumanoa mahlacensis]
MQDITIYNIDLRIQLNQYYYSNTPYILFKLQKKIYEASKQCNLSLVHGLQKLLISLSSVQLLAKNKVHKNVLKNNAVKEKYEITQINDQVFDKILKKEINKKITYWLLEAEWKAKTEFNSTVQKHALKKFELLQTIAYSQKVFYLEFKQIVHPKHIQIQYLILKLQSFNWINKQIISILETEYNVNSWYKSNQFNKQNLINGRVLFHLLSEIIHIGFRWSIFRQTKAHQYNYDNLLFWEVITTPTQILYFDQGSENLYQVQLIIQNFLKKIDFFLIKTKICCITSLNNVFCFGYIIFTLKITGFLKFIKIKPNTLFIKTLIKSIKNNIYHKDKLGKIRANTNITLKSLIDKLNSQSKTYQQYLSQIIDKSYLRNIACIIDEIIYRWMKKKYSTKMNNKLLYKLFN